MMPMSQDAKDSALTDTEAITAELAGQRVFVAYSIATLLSAAAARGAINAEQVLAVNRKIASGFRQSADAGRSGKVHARALAAAADMLNDLEAAIRKMATIPAGAGHA
jgi:hypothetical protein